MINISYRSIKTMRLRQGARGIGIDSCCDQREGDGEGKEVPVATNSAWDNQLYRKEKTG